MKKAVIFGAGDAAKMLLSEVIKCYDIVYATDNDANKYGKELIPGIVIKDKKALLEGGFDCIVIGSYTGLEEITCQLVEEFSFSEDMIVTQFVEPTIRAKHTFLESFAQIAKRKNINGDVCEAGVYRGSFAKKINRCFHDRDLYLFDNFGKGHEEKDIAVEREMGFSNVDVGSLSMTSEALVISRMPFPERCIIKKGYFPETFDLFDNQFCFVNIDLDLYMPVKSALELFYPRMVPGGIILVHDYMWDYLRGVSQAVDEFAKDNKMGIIPIGDGVSIAIVKGVRSDI